MSLVKNKSFLHHGINNIQTATYPWHLMHSKRDRVTLDIAHGEVASKGMNISPTWLKSSQSIFRKITHQHQHTFNYQPKNMFKNFKLSTSINVDKIKTSLQIKLFRYWICVKLRKDTMSPVKTGPFCIMLSTTLKHQHIHDTLRTTKERGWT